ncbi:MAG: hypothetical protein RMJ35_05650 [Phycisphaerales bacterium]|nr:hypothetical protein [Phycisphaerales bacterium]
MRPIQSLAAVILATTMVASAQTTVDSWTDLGIEFRGAYGMPSPFLRDARQYDRQAPLGFPSAETRETLFARARTLLARFESQRAQQRINEQVDRMRRQFLRSPEYLSAAGAEEAAWNQYQAAVNQALARLMQDEQYQAHQALARELSRQIHETHLELQATGADRQTVDATLLSLARARLTHASRASELRSAALSADAAVAEARARLLEAGDRLRKLRMEFRESVKDDPTVLDLREKYHTARANHVAAAAYENLARKLGMEALEYSKALMRSGRAFYDHGLWYESWYPRIPVQVEPPPAVRSPAPENPGYGFRWR